MEYSAKTLMVGYDGEPFLRERKMVNNQMITVPHTLKTLILDILMADAQQGVDPGKKVLRASIGYKIGRAKDKIKLSANEVSEVLEVAQHTAVNHAYGVLAAYLDPDRFKGESELPEDWNKTEHDDDELDRKPMTSEEVAAETRWHQDASAK